MPNEFEPSESPELDILDGNDSTNATVPDSEDSPDVVEGETESSEGSDSLLQGQTDYQILVSSDYEEVVLDYLDYINSGVVCSVVLLAAILGVLVIRCFLDRLGE